MPLNALLMALLALQGAPPPSAPQGPEPRVIVPLPLPAPAAANLPNSTANYVVNPIAPRPKEAVEPIGEEDVRVRILDLVEIEGVRSNQLSGIGLVTGLNNSGDKGNAARQALANFIQRNKLNVAPNDVDIANVALVSVTCTLRPFSKSGTTVDVSVQSINGASSLFGGTLQQTPLFGADGNVYVVAQGPVPVGGFAASGKSASVTQNHPTVGVMSGGGIVEKEVPMEMLARDGALHLHLRTPNYVTATRVAQEIAKSFGFPARALDAATIRIPLSEEMRADPVTFVAKLTDHEIAPGDEAVVVINERTGTVVAGVHVRISTVAITHGNLTISIAESETPSQPNALSGGETTSANRTDITTQVDQRGLQVMKGSTNVSQLASALNQMGVSPRDLVAIFQALNRNGALHARLEIL